ncbi:MAG: hypothetical protein PUC88_07450 [Clostridia bacterium]|nr:hypothetical protein [Clostridia bacterium]
MKELTLLFIRTIICAVVVLSVFVIKNFFYDIFSDFSDLYHTYYYDTMIVDDNNVH